jgi:hypothetical protein
MKFIIIILVILLANSRIHSEDAEYRNVRIEHFTEYLSVKRTDVPPSDDFRKVMSTISNKIRNKGIIED